MTGRLTIGPALAACLMPVRTGIGFLQVLILWRQPEKLLEAKVLEIKAVAML
ncbi:hypothetical protein [Pseudomonas triticifolii]|uniref:hypothetical protein n=1 Tax=Pseudomonas triticifolii TaxID=2762592 RepID=UPI0016546E74|nr:hypothetical protein [Pseudomonas triticifolii]